MDVGAPEASSVLNWWQAYQEHIGDTPEDTEDRAAQNEVETHILLNERDGASGSGRGPCQGGR